jgi:hypothetical protein
VLSSSSYSPKNTTPPDASFPLYVSDTMLAHPDYVTSVRIVHEQWKSIGVLFNDIWVAKMKHKDEEPIPPYLVKLLGHTLAVV